MIIRLKGYNTKQYYNYYNIYKYLNTKHIYCYLQSPKILAFTSGLKQNYLRYNLLLQFYNND